MALDHGVLNVPLAKRGDIDRQLDAYKAEQASKRAASAEANAAAIKALRADAKAMVARLTDERCAALGKSNGLTAKQVRAEFASLAHWSPVQVINALSREVAA